MLFGKKCIKNFNLTLVQVTVNIYKCLKLPFKYKQYKIKNVWNENEEKIVNNIFIKMNNGDDIYALDWQHDGFEFNPNEKISYNYHYYDAKRNCEVYFPSYYPNGDYHFFISKDWSYGMLSHPWSNTIYLWGNELINEFSKHEQQLKIEEIKSILK